MTMTDETITSKYFGIYKTHFYRHAVPWVQKVKAYEKRRDHPFGVVFRQVDGAMRRYLGQKEYELYGDLMTYLGIKEGWYCKDAKGQIDITPTAFQNLLAGAQQ